MRLVILFLFCGLAAAAQYAPVDTSTPVGVAFVRMYNFAFPAAHAVLDKEIARDPRTPLPYCVKAAALFFSELHRLKILQIDFFEDDERVVDRRKLKPDPALHAEMSRLIETARGLAETRLAADAGDRDALFTLCMSAGLVTDYAALVERRRFGSFSLAKQTQAHALRLLALNPPYYDAHLTIGSTEYVVGSLPFFLRWFIRIDQIQGDKQKGLEELRIVAERARYYGPFARVLLAVIHLREKRPWEAEGLLAGLSAEFPENPLFHQELARARELARKTGASSAGVSSGSR
ncbi:MAG: hypothetical protein IT159_06635 [Bryobacterales bacterium]|nr:hypothetical protein [Bryobacterales bacterium]